MYKLLKQEGRAKRGEFHTVHGVIQTPVFMNVGTAAAIKGAVSTEDLEQIKTQVELSNTYHLHVRPGDEVVKKMGGLHKFMSWKKPILTDSGGFQVFSLASLRKIKEEGVYFNSHVDGRKIFMGPEESMRIQSNLASTIAMAFDECPSSRAERRYVQDSVDRTARWLERCKREMKRLNGQEDTINKNQLLFAINQGAVFDDIRIEHAKRIAEMELAQFRICIRRPTDFMPNRIRAFCMVTSSPSSSELYATRPNLVNCLQSCITKLVLPLPLLPQINQTPFFPGQPKASYHSSSKSNNGFFLVITSVIDSAFFIYPSDCFKLFDRYLIAV